MKLTSRDSLDLLDNDRQGPSIAQLRPKCHFALKVWKNGEKIQNTHVGFEPALNWLPG